ncbi:MAG: hemolysin family protein [Planctomycetota bacterium]
MTPRTEVESVEVDDGLEEAMNTILACGHSRLPVYEDTIDSIIGTVTARRVMIEMAKEPSKRGRLRDLLTPPMLVPETKPVAALLREFRDVKQKMAVVLDEYGGTAGIVTMADVVGEIVGEFLEEHDQEDQRIREVERGTWELSAGLHVSEVNEALELEIPEEEDFETLGGFVLAKLGHIPAAGESFEFGDASYAVMEASDRRVLWVRVRTSA